MKRSSGFTLVELLTAIGIIGLLAGLLVPVFSHVREDARRSSCAENLRQIGMAVALYKMDYDGAYPRGADVVFKEQPGPEYFPDDPFIDSVPFIQQVLAPYCHSPLLFQCPSDYGPPNSGHSLYEKYGSSYDVTPLVYGETDICWDNPTDLTYMYDASGTWHTTSDADYFHLRMNQLHLDGHVEFQLDADMQLAAGVAWGGCPSMRIKR